MFVSELFYRYFHFYSYRGNLNFYEAIRMHSNVRYGYFRVNIFECFL